MIWEWERALPLSIKKTSFYYTATARIEYCASDISIE